MEGVTSLSEDSGRSSVAIDDAVFAAPRSYKQLGAGAGTENTMAHRMYTGGGGGNEEDIMLHVAVTIRQSLGDITGTGENTEQVDWSEQGQSPCSAGGEATAASYRGQTTENLNPNPI